ncbi:hypothetical protein INT45_007468 [Circinella minor]|uniref:Restriction of telomere capping protein 4 n=1 Tax=Circinella minor TaxID=1195481 RepID=A0A8H7SG21_9FUNG|nr:hypothetical protein INT45_007468 [Circinella minor]
MQDVKSGTSDSNQLNIQTIFHHPVNQPTATDLDELNVVIQKELETFSTILQSTIETEERVMLLPDKKLIILSKLMKNTNKTNINSTIRLALLSYNDNVYQHEPFPEENAKEKEQTLGVIQDYFLGLQKCFRKQNIPISARQPLSEIIYFVHGNHFQTIRTKRFPRMIWPPVSPKLLAIWESRGRNPKIYKAAWKYIHRKKYPIVQTGKNPVTVEGDGGKPQMKKDELQELNELLAAADAIKLEPEGSTSRRTLRERTLERKVAFEEQLEFCRFHKIELIYKQEGMKKGYPTEINFKSLPERILSHLDTLVKIVKGLLYSSFCINEEEFVQENERVIKRSLFARMSRMEFYTSGYYGARGKAIIVNVLQHELLHKSRITRSDTYPLDELTFIQTILVLECSILLIQEDLSIPSYKDAFNILMSSHEYGLHVYPNPVEEDYDD